MIRLASHLLCPALVWAQTAPPVPPQSPEEWLKQAKLLWTGQGDREGAAAKLDQILAALTPQLPSLDGPGKRLLCDTYNWFAVLDDRHPASRHRVPQHFQAILDLDPEFPLDRAITPPKLNASFETVRDARFPTLEILLQPQDGILQVDGKPAQGGRRRLAVGKHTLAYRRAGFTPVEVSHEVQAVPNQPLRIELTRVASTLSFMVHPIGAEVLLDGKVLGTAQGQADPEARPLADKLGLPLDRLSAPFLIEELTPGTHRLEVRNPCHRTRTLAIPESFTHPLADHLLDPIKLEVSNASLTLTSSAKGGEAFLDGASLGLLPLKQQTLCPGSHALTVKYPSGGFSQTLVVTEGQALVLEASPKPRLAFLGLGPEGDFPGRARLENQFLGLSTRLREIVFLPARRDEKAGEAQARLQASHDAELILQAKAIPTSGVTLLELCLSTLDGMEERRVVKPLDQDPLGQLLGGLESPLPLKEPSLGVQCIDLPGESGPWVLAASKEALKAGLQLHRPITAVQGQAVATVAEFRAAVGRLTSPTAAVSQGGTSCTLGIVQAPRELPFQQATLNYPRVIAELRLRILGANEPEGGFLRLNLARAYLHFDKPDRALEVLRDASLPQTRGISSGTLSYLTGICLVRLGSVYISEAIQAFNQALQDPGATLAGPDGPAVAPLARAALQSLQP